MRVPLSWLKDFVEITIPLDDLIHQHREERVFLPDYAAELDEEDDEDVSEKTPGDDKPG